MTMSHTNRATLIRCPFIVIVAVVCGGGGFILGKSWENPASVRTRIRRSAISDAGRLLQDAEFSRITSKDGITQYLDDRAHEMLSIGLRALEKEGLDDLTEEEVKILQRFKSYRDRYDVLDDTGTEWGQESRNELIRFLEKVPWTGEDQARRTFEATYKGAIPHAAHPLNGIIWFGPNGMPPKLSGKVVLLDFWGIRCGPCLSSFPKLNELYDQYRHRGLEVIAIHAQRPRESKIRELFSQKGYDFPVGQGGAQLNQE